MLCALVLCVLLLSLNSSKAEGIPATDARSAAKKFQNALTQQSLQTVLLSIEERLRNLDSVYAMQYSPNVEGKLEMYGRKLESVEAKISRLEAVMANELDKISENISSRNFKDDLTRDHVLRKIDSVYERMNHRLIFAESQMEMIERNLENKLDTVLSRMEKMEDSLEIKDADMQGEIADVLTCIEELKTQSGRVDQKLNNITKTLNHNAGMIQSDEAALSLVSENITATVRKDMKENFEVLSNKIVDFHETSWQTYDRLERTLRSMSLVSNLTRYEIQNGLRSLTVEVGRLGGGQGLLSDSSTGKSKLHEIDKKIDSNFESLMLAQNLFMENCYRLQKDEPQLETKISEVLDEIINTFNAKTAVAPKDIRRLEQTVKNHDQSTKNALKNLSAILHKSHLTDVKIEDGLSSLVSIRTDLSNSDSLNCNKDINSITHKVEEAIHLLGNLQSTITNREPTENNDTNLMAINKLQKTIEKLTNLNTQDDKLNLITNYVENMSKSIEDIENKTDIIGFIFTEHYKHHFQLFLDDYATNHLKKAKDIFDNSTNLHPNATDTKKKLDILNLSNNTIQTIRENCFQQNDLRNSSIFNCLNGILDEDQRRTIQIYCLFNTSLTEEDCLRNIIKLEPKNSVVESNIANAIRMNCFSQGNFRISGNSSFECMEGILNEDQLKKVRGYCFFYNLSDEACLRNISGVVSDIEQFDRDTIEIIKANCFPSLDVRDSENDSSFQCVQGILSQDVMNRIMNYCTFNNISGAVDCLKNISQSVPIDSNDDEKISQEIIEIIRSNCFPTIDVRDSGNVSLFECVKSVLNESAIQKIQDYCSRNQIIFGEDCFKNLTNPDLTASVNELVTGIIKTNCLPEIDVRSSGNISISDCARNMLDENTIGKIKNYCNLTLGMSEEECLRNLTGFNDIDSNIFDKINDKIKEKIKVNCISQIDIRADFNTNFECLEGILDGKDIETIKTYCSRISLQQESCLNTIINGNSTKANITKRNDDRDDGSSNVRINSERSAETLSVLPVQVHSINASAITRETTTETDYYQASETADHNEYDDYGMGIY